MFIPFADRQKRGGVSGHVFNLTRWLGKENGVSMVLLMFGACNSVEENGGLRVITLEKKGWHRYLPLIPLLKISRVVRHERPNLIHLQGSSLSFMLLYVLLFAPRRVARVVTVHGHPVEEGLLSGWLRERSIRHRLMIWGERTIPRSFDEVVTVTSKLQADLRRRYSSYCSAHFSAVPNGVDPVEFSYTQPQPGQSVAGITFEAGCFTVVNAKALLPFNGQEYLIRAFGIALNQTKNSRLVIIGEGPDLERLKELSTHLGISEKVLFVGKVPNKSMPAILSLADVVVFPSVKIGGVEEGSSLGLVEALACARPVIATDVGGLSEAIVDGDNGLLVPERDVIAMAKAIVRLESDPTVAAGIGKRARDYVIRERTWQQAAQKYVVVYRSSVRRRKKDSGRTH
jgi:glycosyltransferase involved in cell wall biosynthesis